MSDSPQKISQKTTTQLEAWLETVKQGSGASSAPTLLPESTSEISLWAAFAAATIGGSAAPVEIGRTLAEGGMGIVKIAEQPALGRTVVVKTLRGEGDHEQNEQVLLEAWATGTLEHPNIVPVHDIRVDESGAPLIILKRIIGDSWSALMHDADAVRERFGAHDLLRWNLEVLRQITQAIRYAHSKGILHRDLKPDNVMVGGFGEVYLVDWGIALKLDKRSDSPLPAASDAVGMAGTPCYLAPEMLGDSTLDNRTDIYLLGSVLYEILCGKPPHSTESLPDLIRDIRASSPTFPESVSPYLEGLCRTAMAASSDDRFADASAFAEALRRYEQRRGSEELSSEADQQLQAMFALLKHEEIDAHSLYQHFGAVRFAYENALDTWSGNEQADRGLRKARIAMVEYELEQNHPQGAKAILNEIADAPEALTASVVQQIEALGNEQRELAEFRKNSDGTLGRRTRVFVLALLGVVWTLVPLFEHYRTSAWRNNYGGMIAASAVVWFVAILLFVWARDSLMKTAHNRQLSLILNATFPTQIVFFISANALGLAYQHAEVLMLLIWGCFASATAVTVEKRFLPAAIGYLLGFTLAAQFPDERFLIISCCHAVLTVNGIYIWTRPRVQVKAGSSTPSKELES